MNQLKNCSKGHPLFYKEKPRDPKMPLYVCDNCGVLSPFSKGAWYCAANCDYDICMKCKPSKIQKEREQKLKEQRNQREKEALDQVLKKRKIDFINKQQPILKQIKQSQKEKSIQQRIQRDLPDKFKEVIIDEGLEIHYQKIQKEWITVEQSLRKKHPNIESWSQDPTELLKSYSNNGFLETVKIAHDHHIPLCLSPDHIWAAIMQGFGEHMDINHEKLRQQFVNFDGKKTLIVSIDSFKKGQQNPWEQVFPQFTKQIQKDIGKENYQNLIPKFSTTTPTSQAIHELGLMYSMKNYFDYMCMSGCGISKVKLLGTLDDWVQLRKLAAGLAQYDLVWWSEVLTEILDKFIETYQGKPDKEFWKYIYKYYYGRVSRTQPTVNGWITAFFPYVKNHINHMAKISLDQRYQQMISNEKKTYKSGMNSDSLQEKEGLQSTPFKWAYWGKMFDMSFISGFSGTTLTEEGYIKPVLSWAIKENPSKQKSSSDILSPPFPIMGPRFVRR